MSKKVESIYPIGTKILDYFYINLQMKTGPRPAAKTICPEYVIVSRGGKFNLMRIDEEHGRYYMATDPTKWPALEPNGQADLSNITSFPHDMVPVYPKEPKNEVSLTQKAIAALKKQSR